VVLDLNGHKLGNLAAGTGTLAIGISAENRKDLTIRNGTVQGFEHGIFLTDTSADSTTSQGHVIENLRLDRNTVTGIFVAGRGSLIRNNQVVATGGATALGPNVSAFGIEVLGPENRVLDNAVIHTFGTGTGISRGITFSSDPDGLAVNNRITQAQVGIFYVDPSTGKFRDNLTSGVTNPFLHPTTVIDAGGNN